MEMDVWVEEGEGGGGGCGGLGGGDEQSVSDMYGFFCVFF
jgi:hypothetical protein